LKTEEPLQKSEKYVFNERERGRERADLRLHKKGVGGHTLIATTG